MHCPFATSFDCRDDFSDTEAPHVNHAGASLSLPALSIASSFNQAFLACVAATFSIDKHYGESSSHALSHSKA